MHGALAGSENTYAAIDHKQAILSVIGCILALMLHRQELGFRGGSDTLMQRADAGTVLHLKRLCANAFMKLVQNSYAVFRGMDTAVADPYHSTVWVQ